MAGVVNFKLRQEFSGLQFDGGYAQTDRGDGDEYERRDHGRHALRRRSGAGCWDTWATRSDSPSGSSARDFSRYALYYAGPGAGGVGPDGGFLAGGSPAIEEGAPADRPGQPSRHSTPCSSPTAIRPAPCRTRTTSASTPTDQLVHPRRWQSRAASRTSVASATRCSSTTAITATTPAPWSYLQMPLERTSAYGRASFRARCRSRTLRRGAVCRLHGRTVACAPAPSFETQIPATNPLHPGRPEIPARFARESGRRSARFQAILRAGAAHRLERIRRLSAHCGAAAGRCRIAGDTTPMSSTARTTGTRRQQGNALRSRINDLSYASDGGASICGEFSLLGSGRMPDACIDYIADERRQPPALRADRRWSCPPAAP